MNSKDKTAAKKAGISFKTVLLQGEKNTTGIQVPEKVVEELAAGKKPKVRVTVNGYTYRSSIASMGGKFMIGLSAERREQSGLKGGDKIDVTLELDTEPRVVTVPADLQKALNGNSAAKKTFEALSYSHKLQHVLSIDGAKTEETRLRRIAKTMDMLKEGKK
jgi:hypothetical protein